MAIKSADDLTRCVKLSFANAESERYREVMESLVDHLHAFIRDVQLTEEEWEQGIDFLTRTGHITDDNRQEFILASDVLGASMQVVNLNNPASGQATEATVFGPFHTEQSPQYANGDDISNGAKGEPCYVHGRVLAQDGTPIPAAHIQTWESDEDGFYDVQYDDLEHAQNRGQLNADDKGNFWFWAIKPMPYPIPYDGPVGDLLKAGNRSPWRPAHLHFMVTAPGYRRLITHVFDSKSEYLDSDTVFGVKPSLIADFEHQQAGTAPDGQQMDNPFYVLNFDLALVPEQN